MIFTLPIISVLLSLLAVDAAPSRAVAPVHEPLMRRTNPQLGPAKALERLRLRRKAKIYSDQRVSNNAKAAQDVVNRRRDTAVKPVVARHPSNPKMLLAQSALAKRSSKPSVVVRTNPKRSLVTRQDSGSDSTLDATATVGNSTIDAQVGADDEGDDCEAEDDPSSSVDEGGALAAISTRWIPNPKSTTMTSATPSSSSTARPTATITKSVNPSGSSVATASSAMVPVATASGTPGWPSSGGMIAATYFADWEGDLLTPEDVDMTKFDLIDFAFAVPTSDYNVQFTQDNSADLLDRLVALAHGNNTKVLISVGGWTGSNYFSKAVSTKANMNKFIANIVALAVKHKVDGIDIDWEYPGTTGATNSYSISDTANFLVFLTALKAALPANMNRLSACVSQTAFIGANGSPIADVSAFSNILDNILIMNYDVWGASSNPGPNAPLSNTNAACPANLNQPNANELSSIQTWTAAGMLASKILMGVPAYGYISSSSATTLVHKRSVEPVASADNVHRRWYESGLTKLAARQTNRKTATRIAKRQSVIFCPGNHSGKPCAGITNQTIDTIPWSPLGNGSSSGNRTSGNGVFVPGAGIGKLGGGDVSALNGNQIEWYQLLSYAVIVKAADGSYIGTNGYTRFWDACSQTPFLVSQSRKTVITYDDPESMRLKGALAKQMKIGGVNAWDIGGDSAGFVLTNAWRSGMGLA